MSIYYVGDTLSGNGYYLVHHGVIGQKWGVRRYQNYDGSLKTAGKIRLEAAQKRNGFNQKSHDTYLDRGTKLSRIQSSGKLNKNYALYSTYKTHDVNAYSGLFGKNLKSRSGDKDLPIYRVSMKAAKKLRIPSEENTIKAVKELLLDKKFKSDLQLSIQDSASKMKRPGQLKVFAKANKVLNRKIPPIPSDKDLKYCYDALNMSLTNHEKFEIAVQKKFYNNLKSKGYSAILDVNDQKYSSYHAKDPVIIFDTSKVELQACMKMNDKEIDKLFKVYNTERLLKDIPYQIITAPGNLSSVTISQATDYIQRQTMDYLK